GPTACRWCPFRVACQPSWDAWKPDWDFSAGASGIVTNVLRPNQGLEVRIQQDLPRAVASTPMRLIGLPATEIAAGDHIVATDLDRIGGEAARLRWSSRVRVTRSR